MKLCDYQAMFMFGNKKETLYVIVNLRYECYLYDEILYYLPHGRVIGD